MKKFKVKVTNRSEVLEIEKTLSTIGMVSSDYSGFSYPKYIANNIDGEFSDYTMTDSGIDNFKSITIQELRDMVNPMKEYLEKQADGSYKLVMRGIVGRDDDIEVPEGATYYAIDSNLGIKKNYFFRCPNDAIWVDSQWMSASFSVSNQIVLWQRHTQPEELPFMDSLPEFEHSFGAASLNDQYAEIEQVRKHRHYFKDVSNIAEIDVYAVLKLFDVTDPCLQHIVKKALCAGKRGHKDMMEDLQNIVDTAIRAVELNS